MRSPRLLACFGLLGICLPAMAQPPAPVETPEQQAAHAVGDAFVKAFNQHDANALGALWKQDAVYVSADAKNKFEGRPAIVAAYAQLFKDDPKCTIAARAQSAVKTEAGGMTLAGILDEKHTDGSLTASHFTAQLVSVSGKWLIAKVEEADLPVLQAPAVHLQQLDWFIGEWEDKTEGQQILTTVSPITSGNFLTRRYQRVVDGKPVQSGTQTIGWDQEQQCLRTWLFDEDGSFGEGFWTRDSDAQWSVKMAIKFPDGQRGSLTQILRPISADKIEIQNIDQQIEGASLPNSPVATLVKQPAPAVKK